MSITMSLMIDPVPMLQTLSSLETPNLAQTHTMLEKTHARPCNYCDLFSRNNSMDTHTAAQLIVYSLAGISVGGILGIWVWAAHTGPGRTTDGTK
jgi:hypothetical protein